MNDLTFYRQQRQDESIRTGIQLNDATIYGMFEDGPPELADDPFGVSLVWFVDVRCRGDAIPDDPDDARRWLIDAEPAIAGALAGLSERSPIGQDSSDWPSRWAVADPPDGAEIEIVWTCARRVAAREMSRTFDDIRVNWIRRIGQLASPVEAS